MCSHPKALVCTLLLPRVKDTASSADGRRSKRVTVALIGSRSSAEKWYPTTLQRPNSVQLTGLEGRKPPCPLLLGRPSRPQPVATTTSVSLPQDVGTPAAAPALAVRKNRSTWQILLRNRMAML